MKLYCSVFVSKLNGFGEAEILTTEFSYWKTWQLREFSTFVSNELSLMVSGNLNFDQKNPTPVLTKPIFRCSSDDGRPQLVVLGGVKPRSNASLAAIQWPPCSAHLPVLQHQILSAPNEQVFLPPFCVSAVEDSALYWMISPKTPFLMH